MTLLSNSALARQKGPVIDRIDPPHWWAGMASQSLQLMVSGKDIGRCSASIDPAYPGVVVDNVISLDSPDYLFIYLSLAPDTAPGSVSLLFTAPDGRSKRVGYELRARDGRTRGQGFTAADVLYMIMPDRFARGKAANAGHELDGLEFPVTPDKADPNARHGGNLAGIADRLDYIDSLGVTALWLNPVLENDMPGGSYHGYATTDYYAVDPRFGTNDEYRQLIDSCHERGVKVVMDMIFNHCGSNHQWLKNPPSADWINFPDTFTVTNHRLSTVYDPYAAESDRRQAVDGWFVREMPDLNQRNPHLMTYLIQNSIWWVEDAGIDGIRMDTYPYADASAMARWCKAIEDEYPDFNIVGECWYAHEAPEAFWQRGSKINPFGDPGLPTVMDFKLMTMARDIFDGVTGPYGQGGLNELYNHLALDFIMPDPQKILSFLDNHDTDRFLLAPVEDSDSLASWKQAIGYLLTGRGIPQIYYGTELLMNGSKEGSDGYVRRDVPVAQFSPKGRSAIQNEAFDYIARLLHWRRGHAKLMEHGKLKHYAPLADGVYAYSRWLPDGSDRVVVIMNGHDEPTVTALSRFDEILRPGERMVDVVTGEAVTLPDSLTLPARATLILQPIH